MIIFAFTTILISQSLCKIYFYESFDGDYNSRWVKSSKSDAGEFVAELPKSSVNETDKKLKTSQDAKFYHLAAAFDEVLDTSKNTVVVQFSAHFEQDIDCGGGYVKVLLEKTDLKNFDGDTKYGIMFGPDICGYEKKMIHAILSYKDKNNLIKKKIDLNSDSKPHVYTFILRTDKSYEVLLDGKQQVAGKIDQDWDLLPPKTILDPEDKKPSDWVDDKEIADSTDKKPDDWDKPENIPDQNAKKPDDWNDEEDGDWTPPTIPNPDYKGEWRAKMIPNPAYKGEWVQKTIDNPQYSYDDTIGHYSLGGIGFDLWQVKSGTLFDDVLVTDDEAEAKVFEKMMLAKNEELKDTVDRKQKEEQRLQTEKDAAERREKEKSSKDAAEKDDSDDGEEESTEIKDDTANKDSVKSSSHDEL